MAPAPAVPDNARMTPILLAEGPSIDGPTVALILAVFLGVTVVVPALGFVAAHLGGKGSGTLTAVWALIATVELVTGVASLSAGGIGLVPLALLGGQWLVYRNARHRSQAPPPPPERAYWEVDDPDA